MNIDTLIKELESVKNKFGNIETNVTSTITKYTGAGQRNIDNAEKPIFKVFIDDNYEKSQEKTRSSIEKLSIDDLVELADKISSVDKEEAKSLVKKLSGAKHLLLDYKQNKLSIEDLDKFKKSMNKIEKAHPYLLSNET